MLRIGKEQKQRLAEAARDDFEDRVAAHARRFFQATCDALGDAELRRLIRHGEERAARYGVVSERGVCLYVDVMLLHGRDFDTDPGEPWAAAILRDESIRSEKDRARRLIEEAWRRAHGPSS